ncbi:GCN5 family acetyltransferase [Streptomyces sp. NRRL F-5755]|uniref:GNAT family N-acetyltransferase n=1 Tax=Streptomyces sp. NRRL F-5755 TaxID=1519475 RepID=UPI0006B065EC|nr:GNAT family N-acetyltransferase [Streptomyces sp. NRRL F-5755]KOT95025.1 GCN5 family acetyltransferase [Streptomyces sp. NRRL F-5755]
MSELAHVAWPPAPIKTERPRPRDECERTLPEVPERRVGLFVIELDGAMIGTIELNRRDAERRSHVRPDAGEAELGYLLLPQAWGYGYAAEACAAVLGWFADALPGEPVVLCTQTANIRSMRLAAKLGFTEVQRYEAWGAEQWMGIWSPAASSG